MSSTYLLQITGLNSGRHSSSQRISCTHKKYKRKRLKKIKDSAVSSHLLQCNCTIDFDHFDNLATDVSKFNLLVKETLLIKHDNLVLNRTTKSFSLELFD